MSNNRIDNSPFINGTSPEKSIETVAGAGGGGPYPRAGELGHVYIDYAGRRWQKVQAAAVLTHAPAINEIWYWAAAHGYLVDSDLTDSEAGLNSIAGIVIATATLPTASQLFWLLQEGNTITASGQATNFLVNMNIIGSATVGLVQGIAQGTAPTSQVIGRVHTAVDRSGGAGTVVIDLEINSRLA